MTDIVVFICAILFTIIWWNVSHSRANWLIMFILMIVESMFMWWISLCRRWSTAVTCVNHDSELHHTLIPPAATGGSDARQVPAPTDFPDLVALALAVFGATLPKAAHAAPTLTRVTGFGSDPGALEITCTARDGLAAGAPVVVALHGCGQSASDYFGHAGWQKFADQWKFALVFPDRRRRTTHLSCFNWYLTGDTARDQGEALSIKQMVDYAVANYGLSAPASTSPGCPPAGR